MRTTHKTCSLEYNFRHRINTVEGCSAAERHCVLEVSGGDSQGYFNLEGLEKWVGLGHSTFQVERIEPMTPRRARGTVPGRPAFSWQRLGLGAAQSSVRALEQEGGKEPGKAPGPRGESGTSS